MRLDGSVLEQQRATSNRRDWLYPDFGELVKKQLEVNQWYMKWAKSQDGESFSKRSKFNYVNGTPAEMTRGGMFLHIINHKTYHRGWVSEMFFEHNINPPETDLCVYLCLE